MINYILPIALLGLVTCNIARAQGTPVEVLEMGQSEGVAAAINAACDSVTRTTVTATRFPAASDSGVHLRCSALTLADGSCRDDGDSERSLRAFCGALD